MHLWHQFTNSWVFLKSLTAKATTQQQLCLATPGCRDKLSKYSSCDRQNCCQNQVVAATMNPFCAITGVLTAKPVSLAQYSSHAPSSDHYQQMSKQRQDTAMWDVVSHEQLQQWLWLPFPTTETRAGEFIPELVANSLVTTNMHYYHPKPGIVEECANTACVKHFQELFISNYSLHIWGWTANPWSALAVVPAELTRSRTASVREGPRHPPFPSMQTQAVPGTCPADHQTYPKLIQLTNAIKVCWSVGLVFADKLIRFLGSTAPTTLTT